MYLPQAFKIDDAIRLHQVIRNFPLGTLITRSGDMVVADHIPFLINSEVENTSLGVLQAHVARANPLWHTHPAGVDVLVIFKGPDHYISPTWYPTKHETGKAVPTWNYVAVHAYGTLQVKDDPTWIRRQIEMLTTTHESGREPAWAVGDAPQNFIAAQMQAIVGIEITITRLEGKQKTSQNRLVIDRQGVVSGLAASSSDQARAMAALVTETIQTH
jgi:transcriptional regulator